MLKISILIPYYNEEETIRQYEHMLFPVVCDIMSEYGFEYEYVFYDDGSTDNGSWWIIKFAKMLSFYDIKCFHNVSNMGLGAAIRRGLEECDGDYIIIMDADLSYRPSSIRDILECFRENYNIDCVSASPYQYPHTSESNILFLRNVGSRMFNKLYSVAIGHNVTCATSMFRLYKANVIKDMKLKSKGFDINAEILSELILSGKNVIEIPVTLYGRDYGISKMKVLYETRRGIEMIIKIWVKRIFRR
jgi:dolichol-phosphate mannosyltransferase